MAMRSSTSRWSLDSAGHRASSSLSSSTRSCEDLTPRLQSSSGMNSEVDRPARAYCVKKIRRMITVSQPLMLVSGRHR